MKIPRERFEELVEQALQDLPEPFDSYMENILIEVQQIPDAQTCRQLDLASPHQLLGLYRGVPFDRRTVFDTGRMPDRITIYQANIERICRTPSQLTEQVRKTVLHEIGHHFGMSEEELDDLGY